MSNKSAAEYQEETSNAHKQYITVINDYVKEWPKYQAGIINNDIGVDPTQLKKIDDDIITAQHQFFTIKNELQSNITILTDGITTKDIKIDKLTKENEDIKKKINSVQDKKYGSDGMLYDEQVLYNQYNLGNWFIIAMMSCLLFKLIKPKITSESIQEIKAKGMSITSAMKL